LCNTLLKNLLKRHPEQNLLYCLCLQAIPDGSGSDAEAAPLAPRPTPTIHPSISSNLHLSRDLPPFEPPPLAGLTDDVLAGCLRTAFGYGTFRGQQLEVVRRVLDGHSTLAVLPTGGLPQHLIIVIVVFYHHHYPYCLCYHYHYHSQYYSYYHCHCHYTYYYYYF